MSERTFKLLVVILSLRVSLNVPRDVVSFLRLAGFPLPRSPSSLRIRDASDNPASYGIAASFGERRRARTFFAEQRRDLPVCSEFRAALPAPMRSSYRAGTGSDSS